MSGQTSDYGSAMPGADRERALALSTAALERIQALGHRPTPLNYEIWYVYCSASNRKLNRAIDETFAYGNEPTESDLERLYEIHLSKMEAAEQVDRLSTDISTELQNAIELLKGAEETHAEYGQMLSGAHQHMADANDLQAIFGVIQQIISSTVAMRTESGQLKERLEGSTKEILSLQSRLEAVRIESQTDTLTGLSNRKRFNEAIDQSSRLFAATGEPFSLLMLDIDHFKTFNDTYGHLTGDEVLRLVAQCVKQNVKGQDLTFRYGGEEFAVLLPNTQLKQAMAVAENVRHSVMAKELKKKSTGQILGRITISIGAASMSSLDDCETLIDRADNCLYAAKRSGRNRVSCQSEALAGHREIA